MLSAKKLTGSGEAGKYYDKADYYTKGENGVDISSAWFGKGAQKLGLTGTVEKERFVEVLDGHLKNGQSLARVNGKRTPGWDFTFSAPKSVSLLALIGGDERLLQAHFDAVKGALSFAEQEYLVTRVKQGGETKTVATGNLTAGLFTHTTSRELDPQLHTHSVIVNATHSPDGKWRCIESKPLYNNKMLLGQVYRAELAASIQNLGYEIDWDRRTGTFELTNIEQSTLDHFSKRRQKIKDYADKKGLVGGKALAEATLKTRSSKKDVKSEKVIQQWDNEAESIGFHPEQLVEQARSNANNNRSYNSTTTNDTTNHTNNNQTSNNQLNKKAASFNDIENVVRFAYRNLSFNEAVFSRQNVIKESILFSRGQYRTSDISIIIDKLVDKKELINARITTNDAVNQIGYTTPKAIEVEQHNLQLMSYGMNELGGIANQAFIESGLENYNLKSNHLNNSLRTLQPEQADTVRHVLQSKDRVVGIQGYAGVGKSTGLYVIREIAEQRGYKVSGFGPTGKAAQALMQSSGINSNTLDSLLESLTKSEKLPDLTAHLWVIDEASMSNSNQINKLLNFSRKTNARVVIVGDKDQLSAVEQGKPFEQMQKEGLALKVMSNIQRQKNPNVKNAVINAINGDIGKSFTYLQLDTSKDTGIKQIPNENKRREAITSHYVALLKEAVNKGATIDEAILKHAKLIIPDNKSRREANKIVREKMQKYGLLALKQTTTEIYINTGFKPEEKADFRMYKEGQVVRFLKDLNSGDLNLRDLNLRDNKALSIRENDYLTISKINKNGTLSLVVKEGAEGKKGKKGKNDKKSETILWNPATQGGKDDYGVSIYDKANIELAKGDFIRWRDKNKEADLKNADIGKVINIDESRATIQLQDGRHITFDLTHDRYKHFEYEYASTVYASQGDTYNKVVVQLDSMRKNLVNQQSYYVALSRAVVDVTIYTDDIGKTIKGIEDRAGGKTSALEGIGYFYNNNSKNPIFRASSVPHRINLENIVRDAVHDLSDKESVFSRHDLIKKVVQYSKGSHDVEAINVAIDNLAENKEIRPAFLSNTKSNAKNNAKNNAKSNTKNSIAAFTTDKIILKEWLTIERAKKGVNQVGQLAPKLEINNLIISDRFSSESNETKASLQQVLSNADRFSAIKVSGRNTRIKLIKNINAALEMRGFNSKILTISGKQADHLHQETGAPSFSVASFLHVVSKHAVSNLSPLTQAPLTHSPSTQAPSQTNVQSHVRSVNDVWIVDQSQMLGTTDFEKIMQASEKENSRVIFMGDTKSLQAINQGKSFEQLINAGMNHHQHNAVSKEQNSNPVDELFSNVIEIKNRDERLHASVEHCTQLWEVDREQHLFWVPNNYLRKEINQLVREKLKSQGVITGQDKEITVHEKLPLAPKESIDTLKYNSGMLFIFHSENNRISIEKGKYYQVIKCDVKTVTLESNGKQIILNSPDLDALLTSGFSVFKPKNINVATGEILRWKTKNKFLGLNSGDVLTVIHCKNEVLTVSKSIGNIGNIGKIGNIEDSKTGIKEGEVITLELNLNNNSHKHFDYGYSSNEYDAAFGQYKSATVLIAAKQSRILSPNVIHAVLSHVDGKVTTFTDNIEQSKQTMKNAKSAKESALEGIGVDSNIYDQNNERVLNCQTPTNTLTPTEAVSQAANHLYNNESVFNRSTLLKTAIKFSGLSHQLTNKEIDAQIKAGNLVQSSFIHDGIKHEAMITTKSAARRETYMLEVMKKGKNDNRAIGKGKHLIAASNKFGLNNKQELAASNVLFGKNTFSAIEGTHDENVFNTIRAINDVATNNKLIVKGFTPRSELTQDFNNNTGIESRNIQSHLTALNNRNNLKKAIKPNAKREFWIIHGCEMLSTKEMADILTLSKQTGARVLLSGDTKQNASVGQGMPFKLLLDNGLPSNNLYEIKKGRAGNTQLAWYDAFKGFAGKAMDKLSQESKEIPDETQRLETVANDYLMLSTEERKDHMLVVPNNKSKDTLTLILREGLKHEGAISEQGIQTSILSKQSFSKEQRALSVFYEKGMFVRFNSNFKSIDIKKDQYCQVLSTTHDTVLLEKEDGSTFNWCPSKIAGATERGVSVYIKRDREINKGDSIRFNEKNAQNKVNSGTVGKVVSTDNETLMIKLTNGSEHIIDMSDFKNKHFDYAYVETYYSAQGVKNVKNILGVIESYQKRLLNQKSFFTVLNKTKNKFTAYVDNKKAVKEQLERVTGTKLNALDVSKKVSSSKMLISKNSPTKDARKGFMKNLGEKLFGNRSKNLTGVDL